MQVHAKRPRRIADEIEAYPYIIPCAVGSSKRTHTQANFNTNMKSVLITGCSDGGIGSALAVTFAQRGLLVFATTRNISSMSKLENLPNVRLLAMDITNPTQVRDAVGVVKKETGGTLDYLVNNAAQGRFMPLLDEAEGFAEAKELFEVNVWAQLSVTQAFAPLLIEAKGTIVYISSVAGQVNVPWVGKSYSL